MPNITVTDDHGIAVVRLTKPPANTMDPPFLEEGLRVVADLVDADPDAVVLTGGGKFFSGGFDLNTVPSLSPDDQRGMVHDANRAFRDWYGFPRPLVTAINGHAVAGGLILALCGDQRYCAPGAKLGLTEVKVGIPYPVSAIEIVRAEVPRPMIRRLVLGGELVEPEDAHAGGVVDGVVDDVLAKAMDAARALASHPKHVYARIKSQLRSPTLDLIAATAESDPLADSWLTDETAAAASAVLDRDR